MHIVKLLSTATVAVSLTVGMASVASAQEDLASRFTLGVLPDTQYYSRDSRPTSEHFHARYGVEPYKVQTQWLADNKDAFGMKMVMHLGDIVDHGDSEKEWQAASSAMESLEKAGVPYSILPGNHDMITMGGASKEAAPTDAVLEALSEAVGSSYDKLSSGRPVSALSSKADLLNGFSSKENTPFSQWFPAERAEKNSTFKERYSAPNNESEYNIVNGEGQDYLVLALAWRADDATLDWAQHVIDEHPTLPVILTSHEIMREAWTTGDVYESLSYGQHIWDKLIKKNDQIFLTLSGHNGGSGNNIKTNDFGNPVINVLADYQFGYEGGNGMLDLLQFDLTNNCLEVLAGSPYVAAKPASTINNKDILIYGNGKDSWKTNLNFAERFRGFNPNFKAGTPDDPDYLKVAADKLRASGQGNAAAGPLDASSELIPFTSSQMRYYGENLSSH